jgi:hypothetical protein
MISATPFGDPSVEFLDLVTPTVDLAQQDVGYTMRYISDSLTPPHVVIEEDHDDELIITQHPVEFGAIISDHAYKKPAEVRIRCAWNNSGAYYLRRGQSENSAAYNRPSSLSPTIRGEESYVRAIYEQLIDLQESRVPFSVLTGKRAYNDMLVANIRIHTAPGSEYSLLADITLRQIILVSTNTINIDPKTLQLQNTTPQINNGQVTSIEVPNVTAQTEQASGATLGGQPLPAPNVEQSG